MSLALTQGAMAPAPRRAVGRWGASLALVLLVHSAIGWLLLRHPTMPPLDPMPPAVILDLAPPEPVAEPPPAAAEPAAAEAPPPPDPVPPEPILPEPVRPEPPPPEAVIPDAVPLPDPPKPVPPPKPQMVKPPRPRPVPQRAAPAPTEAPPAEAASAPAAAAPSTSSRAAAASATLSWQGRLQAHLARFKQYPAEARMRRDEGTPVVRFTMTRNGKVLAYRLENGSGHDLLDREALALIERAQPLPPLPEELPQATIELVLPLRFQLH